MREIKALCQLGIEGTEGNILNLIKYIYSKPTTYVIYNGEWQTLFPEVVPSTPSKLSKGKNK